MQAPCRPCQLVYLRSQEGPYVSAGVIGSPIIYAGAFLSLAAMSIAGAAAAALQRLARTGAMPAAPDVSGAGCFPSMPALQGVGERARPARGKGRGGCAQRLTRSPKIAPTPSATRPPRPAIVRRSMDGVRAHAGWPHPQPHLPVDAVLLRVLEHQRRRVGCAVLRTAATAVVNLQ